MTSTLDSIYGLYYPDSEIWFANHQGRVFVMNEEDADHVRNVLGRGSPEPITTRKYEGKNSVIYDGPLLEFER